jgi:hypothetical protein
MGRRNIPCSIFCHTSSSLSQQSARSCRVLRTNVWSWKGVHLRVRQVQQSSPGTLLQKKLKEGSNRRCWGSRRLALQWLWGRAESSSPEGTGSRENPAETYPPHSSASPARSLAPEALKSCPRWQSQCLVLNRSPGRAVCPTCRGL